MAQPALVLTSGPPLAATRINWASRVVVAAVGDLGAVGANQTAAINAMKAWSPDAFLLAGDNSYGSTGPSVDLAALSTEISAQKVWRALGNHDIESSGKIADDAAVFSYLPGNKRYYKVTLGGGLIDVFVLSSGLRSDWTLWEADGNTVGSVQHQWFVAAAAASQARWKIVMFHHPHVSGVAGAHIATTAMDWGWHLYGIHAVVCGHAHTNEVIVKDGVPFFHIAAPTQSIETVTSTLQGATANASILWKDDTIRCVLRFEATADALNWRVYDQATGLPVTSGDVGAAAAASSALAAWTGLGYIWTPDESVVPGYRHLGYLPRNFHVEGVRLSSLLPQSGNLVVNIHRQSGGAFNSILTGPLTLDSPSYKADGVSHAWGAGVLRAAEQTLAGGSNMVVEVLSTSAAYAQNWKSLEVALLGTWLV